MNEQMSISDARTLFNDEWIANLTGTEARNLLRESRDKHLGDLEAIAAAAAQEAETRGYCSTYDDIFSAVASAASVKMPERTRTYEVWVDVPVRVIVAVKATSQEEAAALAVDRHQIASEMERHFGQGALRANMRSALGYWESAENAAQRATAVV